MIKLNLHTRSNPVSLMPLDPPRSPSLDELEGELQRVTTDLFAVLHRLRETTLYVPTDILRHAVQSLFPPERMGILGGVRVGERTVLSVMRDVTGRTSHAHVTADPGRLGAALLALERGGAALAGWIHSHPGGGPEASRPSPTDRTQYADWSRDFGDQLLGIIVTRDGLVRFWGQAVESGSLRVELVGNGAAPVEGQSHVYHVTT